MCYSVAPILACRWTVFSWLYFLVWSFPTSTQLRCILGRHVIEASFYTLCCCRFKVFSCQHISYNTWSSLNSCFYLGVWRLISGVVSLNGKDLWKWNLILSSFSEKVPRKAGKLPPICFAVRTRYLWFGVWIFVLFLLWRGKLKRKRIYCGHWLNGWMIEWMNGWVNEWMNECFI